MISISAFGSIAQLIGRENLPERIHRDRVR
ncbi:hypothetical protein WP1_058 [Pseudomonas phage WP1]